MSAGEAIRSNIPLSGINQTSYVFGAVFFAFVFFVTVRGDLGKWIGLLGLAPTLENGDGSGAGNGKGTSDVASPGPHVTTPSSLTNENPQYPLNYAPNSMTIQNPLRGGY